MRGSIKQRSPGSWSLIIPTGLPKPQPRQVWRTHHGTKKGAEAKLARLVHEMNTGGLVAGPNTSVAEFLNVWLTDIAARVTPKTLDRYRGIVDQNIIPAIGSVGITKLIPTQIQVFLRNCLTSGRKDGNGGLSDRTVLHIHRVLHSALADAVGSQIIPRNPAYGAKPPRAKNKPMQALTPAATQGFLDHLAGTDLHAPAMFSLLTGIRRGELLSLKWDSLDLEAKEVIIRQSLEQSKAGLRLKEPKTLKGRRKLSMPASLVEEMRCHRLRQLEHQLKMGVGYIKNDLVFPRPDGSLWPPDSYSNRFAAVIKRYRLKTGHEHFRLHDLRHTSASQMLSAGIHVKIVSERLGHSSIATTMDTYSHVLPGIDEEAAAKVDAMFRAAKGRNREQD